MPETLPTGETLPQYDDQHPEGVDIAALHQWVIDNRGWPGGIETEMPRIRDVLTALQAVGDATLVKNATYRAMRKDGADIERLAARLANNGLSNMIIEHGGPVGAVLAILDNLDVTTKDGS